MPSYEFKLDESTSVGSRFVAHVNEELQRAWLSEKNERKITQQSIAETLGVNRSVVNRRFMGLENLTARSIAETLWALGWEPYFEARKIVPGDGQNELVISPPKTGSTAEHEVTLKVNVTT